nr:centromere protein s [Hymenolepis microstoma]
MDTEKVLSDVNSEHLATLHYECTTRAKEISERSGVKIPDEIASLVTETTFRFCHLLSTDIESFARHAKRSTINMDDVLLFSRRNPLLTAFLLDKSTEFDTVADAKEPNSDLQPAKRKKQTTLSKLKDGSSSKSEESPLKLSPLNDLFIQSEKMTSKNNTAAPFQSPVENASPVVKSSVESTDLKINEKTNLQGMLSECIHEPKSSTLPKGDIGEGAKSGAFETSLFDDKDDFSNIFDDFDSL